MQELLRYTEDLGTRPARRLGGRDLRRTTGRERIARIQGGGERDVPVRDRGEYAPEEEDKIQHVRGIALSLELLGSSVR